MFVATQKCYRFWPLLHVVRHPQRLQLDGLEAGSGYKNSRQPPLTHCDCCPSTNRQQPKPHNFDFEVEIMTLAAAVRFRPGDFKLKLLQRATDNDTVADFISNIFPNYRLFPLGFERSVFGGPYLVHLDFKFGDNPGAFHIFAEMAGQNENVGQAMLLALSHHQNTEETWVVREMVTIKTVKARQVFDTRGNPIVEVDIICSNGTFARAAVLNGASTGISEPLKLKDGGSDYLGKGVLNVVENVNAIIGPALIGKDPTVQTKIDNFMVQVLDGTVNEWDWCKPKLGVTTILAVSLAICKTGASVKNLPLYQHIANMAGHMTLVLSVPAFSELNGGSPAGNKLAVQKFMILPVGASSFKEAMQMGVEVYHHLKTVIKKDYGHAVTSVHGSETNVENAIINMYSKCRAIYASDRAFTTMYRSDEVSWSTIIGAYE
ncbi:uncharacterized protein [Aristolochia californica]|uniref:uncharacterized protein n=1 Tax=Aristolochia californica TaxID=171875 RepID=UPI0035D9DF46